MKALSLTQPWADVILEQGKRIENRVERGPWKGGCSYRGPVLLHASLDVGTRVERERLIRVLRLADVPEEWIARRFKRQARRNGGGGGFVWTPRPHSPEEGTGLHLGGVVGLARIVDVVRPEIDVDVDRVEREHELPPNQRRWWFGGFALVLQGVEPLPFFPCRGALGLWELPLEGAAGATLFPRGVSPALYEGFRSSGGGRP